MERQKGVHFFSKEGVIFFDGVNYKTPSGSIICSEEFEPVHFSIQDGGLRYLAANIHGEVSWVGIDERPFKMKVQTSYCEPLVGLSKDDIFYIKNDFPFLNGEHISSQMVKASFLSVGPSGCLILKQSNITDDYFSFISRDFDENFFRYPIFSINNGRVGNEDFDEFEVAWHGKRFALGIGRGKDNFLFIGGVGHQDTKGARTTGVYPMCFDSNGDLLVARDGGIGLYKGLKESSFMPLDIDVRRIVSYDDGTLFLESKDGVVYKTQNRL